MSFSCISCKKGAQPIVTLVCDHQMCLVCAQKMKIPEGKPPLDAKFRLVCPTCSKSTVTHNVQNLINQDDQKLLFENIESSQLNQSSLGQPISNDPTRPGWSERQLKEMSYSQRFNNIWAERKTPDIADRQSKASNDSKRNTNSRSRSGNQVLFSTKCHIHQQVIMFFCEQERKVMCMECMYKHTKECKSHKVFSIKDALGIIQLENKNFKVEAKRKMDQIEKCVTVCKVNRGKVQQAHQIHQQLIEKEFRDLQALLKQKEEETLQHLEKVFDRKQKEVTSQLNDLTYLKNCLKEHYQYNIDSPNSQLYFFNAYTIMRGAINKVSTNFKPFEKEELACFDKLASLGDFKSLLDKFIRPKKDGRDSKAPSRGTSEGGERMPEKSKSILYEEYKNAKKKLQRLDKMEKEHKGQRDNKDSKDKTSNYLNNYVIEINKKQNQISDKPITGRQRERQRERKSSTGYYNHQQDKKVIHKTLTPTRIVSARTKKK